MLTGDDLKERISITENTKREASSVNFFNQKSTNNVQIATEKVYTSSERFANMKPKHEFSKTSCISSYDLKPANKCLISISKDMLMNENKSNQSPRTRNQTMTVLSTNYNT